MATRQSPPRLSFGWIGGMLPVAYCFGLVYYFNRVDREYAFLGLSQNRDFMSTVVGLSVVGLLFSLPLLLRFIRFISGLSGPSIAQREPNRARWDEEAALDPDFDADAVLARYMARRGDQAAPAESEPEAPARPAPPASGPSFGRRKV